MTFLKNLQLLALATLLAGVVELEAKLTNCDVAGVYFRTEGNRDINTTSNDVFILDAEGIATYLQGNFINTSTDPLDPELFNQIAYGTWAFDPCDSKAIYVSTVGFQVPFLTSKDLEATRYAHRLEFNCHNNTNKGFITDRQFIGFTTADLNLFSTAALFNPNLGTTLIANSHLAVPREITKYPKATKLAIPDLKRSP